MRGVRRVMPEAVDLGAAVPPPPRRPRQPERTPGGKGLADRLICLRRHGEEHRPLLRRVHTRLSQVVGELAIAPCLECRIHQHNEIADPFPPVAWRTSVSSSCRPLLSSRRISFPPSEPTCCAVDFRL